MAKDTCNGTFQISTAFLKREGYLSCFWKSGTITCTWRASGHKSTIGISGGVGDDPHFRLNYTTTHNDGSKDVMDYRINLTSTPCHFGGRRWWLVCPLVRGGVPCGRRVGVVYKGWNYFGCRRCHDLAYESQQEPHSGRKGSFWKAMSALYPIESQEWKTRTRYWRGRPTKRYQRYLRRHADDMDDADIADAIERGIAGGC
jgi:hypothetical protein